MSSTAWCTPHIYSTCSKLITSHLTESKIGSVETEDGGGKMTIYIKNICSSSSGKLFQFDLEQFLIYHSSSLWIHASPATKPFLTKWFTSWTQRGNSNKKLDKSLFKTVFVKSINLTNLPGFAKYIMYCIMKIHNIHNFTRSISKPRHWLHETSIFKHD